jgi:hypothetical protein
MPTVSHPGFKALVAGHGYACPVGCELPDMIRCWSRYLRELRADLEAARGHPDEEVLVFDLRNAEAHFAGLMAIARAKAKAA